MSSEIYQKPVILIVDDEPVNINVMSALLRKDYALKVARDGNSAIRIANRNPKPDLILLDVMMPEIDGFAINRSLKSNPETSDIPVIFITAAGKESEFLGFQCGAVDYISKPANNATTLLSIHRHITNARYRKRLQEDQHFLNAIVEDAPLLIAVVSKQNRWLMMNRLTRDSLGFDNIDRISDMPVTSRASGIYLNQAWRCKRALLKSLAGKNQQVSLIVKNGSGQQRAIDMLMTPLKGVDGLINSSLLIGIDITETTQSQERMKLLAKVYENALEGIVITDSTGKVVDFNPAYCQLTGFTAEEISLSPYGFPRLHESASDFENIINQIAETDGKWQGEIFNRRKNGELLAEWLSLSTINNDIGMPAYYVGFYNDITQLNRQKEQTIQLNHFDSLTGLPNQILVLDRIRQLVIQSRREHQLAAVCYLDLDGFKDLSEQYGVDFSNDILQECARRLTNAVRQVDTVARVGNDEFVILLPKLQQAFECNRILDRILASLNKEILNKDVHLTISASIGVTLLPQDQSEADTLLRHADRAMYIAKVSGRNRYHFFDAEEDSQFRNTRAKLERIHQALHNNEFKLFYQPKIYLSNKTLAGAEALIRWQHPEQGILSPIEFLPIIDGTELEIKLGEWVIASALSQQVAWRQAGLKTQVSINISPNHLQKNIFVEFLERELAKHPELPRDAIQIEILETAALSDIDRAYSTIKSCNGLGIEFALDDFGTGYSSLTYLCKLPINTIKIDQTFIREMLNDEASYTVVSGVIALAKSFKKQIVAEGVETAIHMEKLTQLGCCMGQGYGIARPMTSDDFHRWSLTQNNFI